MSENKPNQGFREAIMARRDTCRQCEARIEINEKLHERNVELGARIEALEAERDAMDKALVMAGRIIMLESYENQRTMWGEVCAHLKDVTDPMGNDLKESGE